MATAPDPSPHRHLVIFDAPDPADLAPLSLTRPAFAIRCGMGTLLDNQLRNLRPVRVTLWVREGLAGVAERIAHDVTSRHGLPCEVNRPLGEEAVLLDGRTWWASAPEALGEESETDESFFPLRVRVRRPGLGPGAFFADPPAVMEGRSIIPILARVMRRPWDLVAHNAAALASDAHWCSQRAMPIEKHPPGVHVVQPEAIFAAPGVRLEPGVVLDGSAGPVCLEEGVHIGANSVIRGPCHIGRGTTVFPLTRLNGAASLGPLCKVGGEVGNVIFHGYANKAHDGYLGDSYVGEWVNLGAGTTTSNLKNTYGEIRAAGPRGREATGMQFLGTIFGDHVKCGIGTMLDAGTYLGAGSQVAGVRPPQFVPSFRFLTKAGQEALDIDRLLELARRVAGRRQVRWTDLDDQALRHARQLASEIEAVGGS